MADLDFVLEHPLINITNIIWSFDRKNDNVNLLLVKRSAEPYKNQWALPETFMREDESADEAALRLVREKIGLNLSSIHTEQLATFTNQKRTPDQRTISLAYMTFLPEMPQLTAGYGAVDAKWFVFKYANHLYTLQNNDTIFYSTKLADQKDYYKNFKTENDSTQLAYDHNLIWSVAVRRIRNKLNYQPNVLLILGDTFTLKEARTVFGVFSQLSLGRIDNSNFKKNHEHIFEEMGYSSAKQLGRPAKIYRLRTF